ncbi:uncharacterized protein LOC121830952 [Peromyscus maniculatus bairdii]|uniref:uncharacterized protein LOC121830952 n=1 Tax=Peromyscus maniculatus bairdii TaxID=230844 RepID=UPI003FD0E78F
MDIQLYPQEQKKNQRKYAPAQNQAVCRCPEHTWDKQPFFKIRLFSEQASRISTLIPGGERVPRACTRLGNRTSGAAGITSRAASGQRSLCRLRNACKRRARKPRTQQPLSKPVWRSDV